MTAYQVSINQIRATQGLSPLEEGEHMIVPIEILPKEQLKVMQEYAVLLRKKYPHMKPERLQRKVAEYFKIKLVKNEQKNSRINTGKL